MLGTLSSFHRCCIIFINVNNKLNTGEKIQLLNDPIGDGSYKE